MKIKNLILLFAGATIILSSCGQTITGQSKIENEVDSLSYAIGSDMANNLKRSAIDEINYDLFMKGMMDVYEENELKISEEEVKEFLRNYSVKLREKQAKLKEEKVAKNLEEGIAFLEENKKKEGVMVTPSGLQYEVLKEGTGKSPEANSIVVCYYKGTLIDGTGFDSTKVDEPREFGLDKVMKGWTEGLQLMKEGAKYKFYIPTELGYGMRVRPGGPIEENMALIFEVELLEVKAAPEKKN